MQIPPVQQAARQDVQDEVLSLIRSRLAPGRIDRMPPEQAVAGDARSDAQAAPVGAVQTDQAVHQINQRLESLAINLKFEVDQDSGRTVVKVVDRGSGEVLRQIPSETALQISRSLDKLVGQLVDHTI